MVAQVGGSVRRAAPLLPQNMDQLDPGWGWMQDGGKAAPHLTLADRTQVSVNTAPGRSSRR